MPKHRSSLRFRFFLLLFILVVSPQLQGCKALVFLGGTVVTYTLERVMDKVTNKMFGSVSSPKPSNGTFEIDQSTGKFTIKKQVFIDKRTGVPITFKNLSGTIKDGKFRYDVYSINLIKTAMGASFCLGDDKTCKVTGVAQQ